MLVASADIIDGEFVDEMLSSSSLYVAVDGGIEFFLRRNIAPDYWIGDMDSSSDAKKYESVLKNTEIIKLNVDKDFSDTEYAIDFLITKNYKKFKLLGVIGTRFDHSFANAALITNLCEKEFDIVVSDGRQLLIPLSKSTVIKSKKGYTISIICFEDIESVSSKGLRYKLEKTNLSFASSLSLSNVIEEDIAIIQKEKGRAILVISKGDF